MSNQNQSESTEYQEVLDYLYYSLPMFQRIGNAAYKKDLSNTILLCEALGNPENKFKSVHIAGTNGKGSSAHYMASILQSAGYKTGLYTSPHLKSFTERIRINGIELPPGFVISFVKNHRELIERVQPSFFEITVVMAFEYFAQQKVDVAVIEVGLGGRLDSTNVIIPLVSLITNISMDHQQWLGNTLKEIAREKAGIIKANVPVVISRYQEEVSEVFQEVSLKMDAPILFASEKYALKKDKNEYHISLMNREEVYFNAINLPEYQYENIPGVMAVVEILIAQSMKITTEDIRDGLENMKLKTGLKGRWQQLESNPDVFCDVGHNVAGVAYLIEQINRQNFDHLFIIWGTVNDKDILPILKILPPSASYYFCEMDIPRSLSAEILKQQAESVGLNGIVVPNVNNALADAKKRAGKNDLIVIGGSNFVVAEIENL